MNGPKSLRSISRCTLLALLAAFAVADANALETTFAVPADARPGQTIHAILKATDGGKPSLTRYQRVVVTVQ